MSSELEQVGKHTWKGMLGDSFKDCRQQHVQTFSEKAMKLDVKDGREFHRCHGAMAKNRVPLTLHNLVEHALLWPSWSSNLRLGA